MAKYGFVAPDSFYAEFAVEVSKRTEANVAADSALRRRQEARRVTQLDIVAMIAEGKSKADAARAVGVSIDTLYRWRREDPDFRCELANARGMFTELRTQAVRQHRPAKMTAGVRDEIVRRLREGATRGEAAAAVGVSRQTLYTWRQRVKDFALAVDAAEDAAAKHGAGLTSPRPNPA